ncbi:nucleotide-diphospho-sugar transferase [Globomyces pollinis-pini]|nr:nucleotide-diphospho-sugar transferase [Globomyces pollinis-pini]
MGSWLVNFSFHFMSFATILVVAIIGLISTIYLVLQFTSSSPLPLSKDEQYYYDQSSKKMMPFNSLKDRALVSLSIVIPAYNEAERLPIMMDETLLYLNKRLAEDKSFSYEIIVVEDGCSDATGEVTLSYAEKHHKNDKRSSIKLLTLLKNRGKGGAVIQGISVSSGERILFVDADGASKFSDLDLLEIQMDNIEKEGLGFVIGSRAHMVTSEAVVKRTFLRNILMRIFHLVVFVLGVHSIKDTQCGFKLFTRKAAQKIIPNMHSEGWIFDIELLILAFRKGIPVREVPIDWQEVEGSKMSLFRDGIIMVLNLLRIRLSYLFGVWNDNK